MLALCLLPPLLLLPSGAATALFPEGSLAGHESGVSRLTRLCAHPLVSCPFPWHIWPPVGPPSSLWLSVCTAQTPGLDFAMAPQLPGAVMFTETIDSASSSVIRKLVGER